MSRKHAKNQSSVRHDRVPPKPATVDEPSIATHDASDSRARRAPKFFHLLQDHSGTALHEQLYRRMRELILSGNFSHGARLAPSRSLASALGMSRNSVLTAIDRLIADGFLESRKGSGVYVAYRGTHSHAPQDISGSTSEPNTIWPFALGTMGATSVDIFPVQLWQRLQSRRWKSLSSNALHEGDPAGWMELREAIATHSAMTRGLQCSGKQVIVTSCVAAAIELAIHALGLAGDSAWIEDPGYDIAARTLRYGGVHPVAIPVDQFGIDVEAGRRLSSHAKAAFVTPACQFPTNVVMSKTRRHALVKWACETGSWILEDDFGWCFTDLDVAPRPLAAMGDCRTIYINTFNHTLFPSLRIAYLVVPEVLLERFVEVQKGLNISPNVPNQMVMADFINQGHLDEHLKGLAASWKQRRATLTQALDAQLSQYLTVAKSTAGAHAICTLKYPAMPALFAECRSRGIAVEPMSKYRLVAAELDQIVLGASFPPKMLIEAVAQLREAFVATLA